MDAISDDGARALTVIAFIGSVFSPYYAIARRAGPADPRDHAALNIALYGVRGPAWAMTERNAAALHQSASALRIGRSALAWQDGALRIEVNERAAPIPRPLRGTIVMRPTAPSGVTHVIDNHGRHRWTPLAPIARVDVAFDQPRWRWSGHGYLDSNDGDAPLENDFAHWDWSRATLADGSTAVLYDVARQDGTQLALARRFFPDGTEQDFAMPPRHSLTRGIWGVPRTTHGQATPRLLRVLEDAPFYTRSLVATTLLGQAVTAMHESLSLDRFSKRWVQTLLPFRMPR